jgi:hypothetical protein
LVDLSDDGYSGAIDLDLQLSIKIPGVADQSGGGQATLTLAPVAPCTD